MELIKVYNAAGQLEAEMIKSFLQAHEIIAVLNQESVGRTYGLSVGPLGLVEVLVHETQVSEALALLNAMDHGELVDQILTNDQEELDTSQIDPDLP
jgi:hypothetical protein